MAGARVAKRVWTEHGVVGLWRWQVWGYGYVEDGQSMVIVGYGFVGLWVYGGGECGVVGFLQAKREEESQREEKKREREKIAFR